MDEMLSHLREIANKDSKIEKLNGYIDELHKLYSETIIKISQVYPYEYPLQDIVRESQKDFMNLCRKIDNEE